PPLPLVGTEAPRRAPVAPPPRERRVGGHPALARIEHEEHKVSAPDRRFALCAHARGDAARRRLFQARRVHQAHGVAANLRLTFASVARQARPVRHQRGVLARQAVEERRLADVRPADDGDGGGHLSSRRASVRKRRALTRNTRKFNKGRQFKAISLALSVNTYMRPPATTGAMKTGWPRSCFVSTRPVAASTPTS